MTGDPRRHALERLLADELADRRPPDLRERIRARLRERAADAPRPRERHAPGATRSRRSAAPAARHARLLGTLLGAAAVLLCWALPTWTRAADPRAEVAVLARVLTGAVTLHRAGRPDVPWPAQQASAWTPQVGDRLRAAPITTRVQLQDYGLLVCAPDTSLEVSNVNWRPFSGGFVAGSITVTALVGAATWYGDGSSVAQPGERLVLAASRGLDDAAAAAATLAEPDRELRAARERIAELEAALQSRREPVAVVAAPAAVEPVAPIEAIDTGAAFGDELRSVDWNSVGAAISGYLEAKQAIEALLAAGEEIPMELRAAADRWEAQLFENIGAVLQDSVPGETVTAKAHHPALMTNMLQATLAAAGLALDPTQRRWIEDIGRRYTLEDARRRAGYGDDTMHLQRFVDEIEMQGRFFAEQRQALGEAQLRRLSFGEMAERTGVDPFGTGFQWSKKNRTITADSRDGLARRAATGLGDDLELTQPQREQLEPILMRWASRLPQEWLDRPMDALDRQGRLHIERVRAAALLQLDLWQELAKALSLSPSQLATLRRMDTIFVPFLAR